jgi:hypothetical protein
LKSEIWGFGLIFYEVVTGEAAFKGCMLDEIPLVLMEKFFTVNPQMKRGNSMQSFVESCVQLDSDFKPTIEEAFTKMKQFI